VPISFDHLEISQGCLLVVGSDPWLLTELVEPGLDVLARYVLDLSRASKLKAGPGSSCIVSTRSERTRLTVIGACEVWCRRERFSVAGPLHSIC